jgi:hypothetical protein
VTRKDGYRILFLTDPFGNLLQFSEPAVRLVRRETSDHHPTTT